MSWKYELDQLAKNILQQCKQERAYVEGTDSNDVTPLPELDIEDPRENLRSMKHVTDVTEYTNLNKKSALRCFMESSEIEGIAHLTESHAAYLRQQMINRFTKAQIKQDLLKKDDVSHNHSTYVNFDLNEDVWNGKTMISRLQELPEDWHIIQITAKYKPYTYEYTDLLLPWSHHIRETVPIHISILPTGKNAADPICISLPKPKNDNNYDIMKEIGTVLYYLKSDFKRNYTNGTLYWSVREKQNTKMKIAMNELESAWLKEWRILFMADFIQDSKVAKSILRKLDKMIREYSKSNEITIRMKYLLRKITLGASYLSRVEIARAVKYTLLNHIELAKQVVAFLTEYLKEIHKLQDLKRKNVVLIIDEHLDHIPFEMITILKNQPVTRMPCLSIAYTLFKEHENTIVNGCKLIEMNENLGTFIVNPAGDLAGTENRLKIFNDYWLKDWKGVYGYPPDEEMFGKALEDYDILMFNGHGNGMKYLSGEQIEKIRVRATALLFGCSSVSLTPIGGSYPQHGNSDQYLIGYSPCILGMLWAVTDGDTDRMTVHFLSQWLKSKASLPWSNVDENLWLKGKLKFKSTREETDHVFEPEMLRAVASSRWSCVHYMTSASIVVRGLPVKLIYT